MPAIDITANINQLFTAPYVKEKCELIMINKTGSVK